MVTFSSKYQLKSYLDLDGLGISTWVEPICTCVVATMFTGSSRSPAVVGDHNVLHGASKMKTTE